MNLGRIHEDHNQGTQEGNVRQRKTSQTKPLRESSKPRRNRFKAMSKHAGDVETMLLAVDGQTTSHGKIRGV